MDVWMDGTPDGRMDGRVHPYVHPVSRVHPYIRPVSNRISRIFVETACITVLTLLTMMITADRHSVDLHLCEWHCTNLKTHPAAAGRMNPQCYRFVLLPDRLNSAIQCRPSVAIVIDNVCLLLKWKSPQVMEYLC